MGTRPGLSHRRGGLDPRGSGPRATGGKNALGGDGRASALVALPLLSSFFSWSKRSVPGGGTSVQPLDPGLGRQADTTKGRAAPGAAPPPRAPAPGSRTWRLPRCSRSLEVGSGARGRDSDVTARPRAPRSASRVGAQVLGEAGGRTAGSGRRNRPSRERQGEPRR